MSKSSRIRISDLEPGNRSHELGALVALLRAQVMTPEMLALAVEAVGSAVAMAQLSEADRLFAPDRPIHDVIGAVTDSDVAQAVPEAEDWLEAGYDVRTVLDGDYPAALRDVFNRPPLVFVDGVWHEWDSYAIAVVGTRSVSELGLRRARKLGRELVDAGFTVFSGLAAGVDTAAHTAVLDAGGRTVAVMGTGIDLRYPEENVGLANRIVDSGGALVSQFLPKQPPARWTFPKRNVVMSGLTQATVVVEASATSGARLQARVALQHGRTVFLLASLVEAHLWAQKYVNEGAYGTQAIPIESTHEIIERLDPDPVPLALEV